NIYLCDHIASPFVIGIVKPKIYLPSSLAENEQKYIILHEQHHIKRFDHIVKLVAFAALSIHWFNPFVWLAFTLLCKDMEMSCDEAVIAKLGLEIRSDYSRSLLNLSTGKHIFAGAPLAFGEGDAGSRIKNLYNYRKPKAAVFVAVAAVCAILGVTLLLNPDNSSGQIYYNGTVYVQSGKAQSGGIVGSKNIGEISSVIADNADFSENFSAKNIDEINRGMPVLQFEDDPYTLWLTTGKGWIPFTAKGMSYQTSDSWVKVSSVEGKADVVFEVDENVNEIAFYEDIYEYGELISSSLVSYANTNDNAPFERKHHNQFSIGYTFDTDKLTVYDIYVDTGVMVTMYAILPKDNYKGYSYGEVSTDGKKPLLANDSVDVAYAILSSYDDARIYSDYTSKNNDTVVVYRLVTRSNPTR
ncbi:MAG: M56 family metallopeptidase, partial [Oscillospiraceae bacterium]|nr:M56 family metallopeptidase [Oscillospiraceae bacterium]